MSSMSIRIPDALRRELEKVCRRKHLAMSDVIRDSLRRYVALEQFRALREKSLPLAEGKGFLTDEDVFKAVS